MQDAFLPDFLDSLVEFALSLDLADKAHLVIDDLAQRWFGLEAVSQSVVVEEPTAIDESLYCLLDKGRVVVGLQYRQPKIGWVNAALARLH